MTGTHVVEGCPELAQWCPRRAKWREERGPGGRTRTGKEKAEDEVDLLEVFLYYIYEFLNFFSKSAAIQVNVNLFVPVVIPAPVVPVVFVPASSVIRIAIATPSVIILSVIPPSATISA